MNAWSNIEVSPEDLELIAINNFEKKLGKLPDQVNKIRALITRLEVCHFKYKQHISYIIASINNLEPGIDSEKIGLHHIQHGETAWEKDTTGKSLLGQQYIWAIKYWLENINLKEWPDNYDKELGQNIQKWLGDKNEDKMRLVRLLVSRMTWDWKTYEELLHEREHKDLEFQICRMDICHFAFPANMDSLLQGIGKMTAIKNFKGCGSFDVSIKKYVEKELLTLMNMLYTICNDNYSDEERQFRIWLIACLMKTLKEQVELSKPVIELECRK